MTRVVDEMPTPGQVEAAGAREIVRWHLYLRATMSNEELLIVKAIARRYDQMPSAIRERLTAALRREADGH